MIFVTPNEDFILPSSSCSIASASSSDDVQPSDCLLPFLLPEAASWKAVCTDSAFVASFPSSIHASKLPLTGDGEPKRLGYSDEK